MSPCPGVALPVVFPCRLVFTPRHRMGPAASPGTARHRGLSWALFLGPDWGAGELGRSGSSPPFPLPGTASPSRQRRGPQPSGEQPTAGLGAENSGWKEVELSGLLSLRRICLLSPTGRFPSCTRQQQPLEHPSEIASLPWRREKRSTTCRTLAGGCSQPLG